MAVNPWLSSQNFPESEQNLVQDLIEESIQIKGMDIRYLVRTMENRDYVFGESSISSFKEFFIIEMYLADIVNFNGQGDIFGSFGLEFNDTATFEVSSRRFRTEAKEFELSRPREGDLIYLPYSDTLFEITKVEEDENFHQIGKTYKYIIRTQAFNISYEEFEKDTPEQDIIDDKTFESLEGTLGVLDKGLNDISELLKEDEETIIEKQFDLNNPFSE